MKDKRFTEEQIIRILQDVESGLAVADVCRKHNCSEQSFYRWKQKFGGMEVSEVKRLKELERENAELFGQIQQSDLVSYDPLCRLVHEGYPYGFH